MVETFDQRHASQPFVLEGLDNAFGHRNGPVFPYGSPARFDIPLFQEFSKTAPMKTLA
jgi:hypothetical protein